MSDHIVAGHHLKKVMRALNELDHHGKISRKDDRGIYIGTIAENLLEDPTSQVLVTAGIADDICGICEEYPACFDESLVFDMERYIQDYVSACTAGYKIGGRYTSGEMVARFRKLNTHPNLQAAKDVGGLLIIASTAQFVYSDHCFINWVLPYLPAFF